MPQQNYRRRHRRDRRRNPMVDRSRNALAAPVLTNAWAIAPFTTVYFVFSEPVTWDGVTLGSLDVEEDVPTAITQYDARTLKATFAGVKAADAECNVNAEGSGVVGLDGQMATDTLGPILLEHV